MDAEPTAPQQRGVPFKPGQSGNPAGRPKGARSQLAEDFIADVYTVWQEGGIDQLRKLLLADPATVVNAIVKILPKTLDVNVKADFVHYLRTLNGNGTRPNGAIEAPVVEGQPGDVRH